MESAMVAVPKGNLVMTKMNCDRKKYRLTNNYKYKQMSDLHGINELIFMSDLFRFGAP